MYFDLFDKKYSEWFSNELMPAKKRAWLAEDIEITNENVGELDGEIGMLRDLMSGRLELSGFTEENIDAKLISMFNHIRPEKLLEAKNTILQKPHI